MSEAPFASLAAMALKLGSFEPENKTIVPLFVNSHNRRQIANAIDKIL